MRIQVCLFEATNINKLYIIVCQRKRSYHAKNTFQQTDRETHSHIVTSIPPPPPPTSLARGIIKVTSSFMIKNSHTNKRTLSHWEHAKCSIPISYDLLCNDYGPYLFIYNVYVFQMLVKAKAIDSSDCQGRNVRTLWWGGGDRGSSCRNLQIW